MKYLFTKITEFKFYLTNNFYKLKNETLNWIFAIKVKKFLTIKIVLIEIIFCFHLLIAVFIQLI